MGVARLLWIRLKASLACLWALVGRAFCCRKWRRKLSNVGPPISVDVQSVPTDHGEQDDPGAGWSWEEPSAVVTVQDKIRAYRETRSRVSESEQQAPEPDFFSDMAPSIRRSQRVLVGSEEPSAAVDAAGLSSRLAYTDSMVMPQAAELTDLVEPSAWEADDIQPDALQSHQRALRLQQLQRKREQRSGPPVR
ncbi:receptor-binding cancer antigen expressed on SiSo cells-like [Pollicipes pollicipes]|uniref:receptor-binding cancer antigen expressed on SiSo cells-like n=1 Tax=Pollicipes pollicipes TaxID=41117 RepID=UPI0018856A11|nr:receptor-binding cancer antigen expressed on SiSo cells-like [Pollicipes pollicipes]